MKIFRTASLQDKQKLAEKGIEPTREENGEFIYEVEEDVIIEDILRVDVPAPTEKKEEVKAPSKKKKKK